MLIWWSKYYFYVISFYQTVYFNSFMHLKVTMFSNMLIFSYFLEKCSYADASGAGKDVYEFVSLKPTR